MMDNLDKLAKYLVTVTNRQEPTLGKVASKSAAKDKVRHHLKANPSFFGCKSGDAKKMLAILLEVPISFFNNTDAGYPELGTIMFKRNGDPVVHTGSGVYFHIVNKHLKSTAKDKMNQNDLKYKVIKESDLAPYKDFADALVKALRVVFI